ncbi:peroxidase-related enzyme [Oscillatoria sp. FACHB-1407]|uniref:carboxymuconolactone decarboxylase family protein n=1 Tax=Oscillatoria sp. FACHB-1407 TaxID=2692847 RepID=UPI001688880A|nr:peroxidase-related enzyme [Oscillatoria sp. FACHB-1407]MBD2464861.1 peroxidase-related enzyme [Oscillatoria sp. FACHB-1407]
MSHVLIIEQPTAVDSTVTAVYEEIKSELGFGMVPNLFKSMANNPGFLKGNWETFRATILQGRLPRTLKEMIGVVISQANQSNYALKVHLHGLSALGISEAVLQLLVDDFESCPLPERQKAIIQFGLKAGTQPKLLTANDYQRLHDLGLDEVEIFEIIATANLFTSVNQYTDAIALDIDAL